MTQIRSDIDAVFHIVKALGPVSIATDTDTDSSAIDISAYPGWKVLLIAAVGTRTDGTFTPVMRECATTAGTYADLAAFSGSVSAISAADTTRTAAYRPTKPFLKVRITSASTTSGALCSAFVVLVPPGA
jgi:hypothetical protein